MRISTKSIYESGSNQLNTLQSALNRSQMQLSTNRRNLTPADDPIATARALEVTQSQSVNTQLVTNRTNAKNVLSQEELALGGTGNLIADIKDLVVKAGNATMKDTDRASIATELEGRLADLMGLANSSDGNGGYLFSGNKSTTQPFSAAAGGGATYSGDQGQRSLLVGTIRQLPTSDAGSTVFESNLTGNGTFTTAASTVNFTNGGSGLVSGGNVTNTAALTGHKYSIDFTVTGTGTTAATSYIVTDTTLGKTIPDPAVSTPYVDGQAINFDGQQIEIRGAPANGDKFTSEPSTKESIFTTVSNVLKALRSTGEGGAGQARLANELSKASDLLDTAYDNVLSVRAEVGSRLKEIDYLDSAGDDLDIQYSTTLSDLQDLDQVKAISLFTQQQTTLQAAQKSFTSMSGLSLFNYIN